MRPRWRHVLRIPIAKASEPKRGGHALFKAYETAIRASADSPAAVNRAPRIVLGFGACSNADDRDANSQHEQQQPHSRLLGWPLSHKCLLSCFIPCSARMRRGGSRRILRRYGSFLLAKGTISRTACWRLGYVTGASASDGIGF
jgi:hypothetical protein